MTDYSFEHIAGIINGRILHLHAESRIEQLVIDSRKIIFPANSIFFALTSQRRDGHDFIDEVYKKGVRNFVVSRQIELSNWSEANFVLVTNTLKSLQRIANHHRKQFSYPVIGITGSNGKTIVKEWLNQLFEPDFNVVRSPKSYNSQIGVPLSVWQMSNEHELAIFEAGISKPGEMEILQQIIQPSIGIFTNIGEAHSEGFTSLQDKAAEKAKLFQNAETVFYCSDEEPIDKALKALQQNTIKHAETKQLMLCSWGRKNGNFLHIADIEKKSSTSLVTAQTSGKKLVLEIPFTDEASIHNAIVCWCILLFFRVDMESIQKRIQGLQPISMRLELKRGINHCTIINDSYSADLSSLKIALDLLSEQRQHGKQTVILSDFLQSGLDQSDLYSQIAASLEHHHVSRIIGLGEKISSNRQHFNKIPEKTFYNSTEEFIANYRAFNFNNEAILLKGARIFAFEQLDRLFAEKLHQTVLEIDLDALTHNLKQFQQQLNPATKVMAMVKAFAYGSGSFEIANTLQFNKVDFLSVAYADEGVELRKAGITIPVMVMNADESSFSLLTDYLLQPVVYSMPILSRLAEFLVKEGGRHFPIHVEINSGMNRLGFDPAEYDELFLKLNSPAFKVISVFSHFAASEDPQHDAFSSQQFALFKQACERLSNSLNYSFLKHISNTAAVQRHPEWQLDMVRLGIGLYGIESESGKQFELQQVSTLRSTIAQLRTLNAGDTVSYGRSGVITRGSTIATVRVGYADGYPRSLGNGRGKMLVNGQAAPTVGIICMDMTMIDVTDIPGVKEADEVIVFGKELTVQQVAHWAQTIPYEILTGISQRVKRVYYQG
jgi:alanine racemase